MKRRGRPGKTATSVALGRKHNRGKRQMTLHASMPPSSPVTSTLSLHPPPLPPPPQPPPPPVHIKRGGTLRRKKVSLIQSMPDETVDVDGVWSQRFAPTALADVVNQPNADIIDTVKLGMKLNLSRRVVVLITGPSGCGKSVFARCLLHNLDKAVVLVDNSDKKLQIAVPMLHMAAKEYACGIVVDGIESFMPSGLMQFIAWLKKAPKGPPVIITASKKWVDTKLYRYREKLHIAQHAEFETTSTRDMCKVATRVMAMAGKSFTVEVAQKLVQALNGASVELSAIDRALGATAESMFERLDESVRHDIRTMVSTMEWMFGCDGAASTMRMVKLRDATSQDVFAATRSFFKGDLNVDRFDGGLAKLGAFVAHNMAMAPAVDMQQLSDDLCAMSDLDLMARSTVADDIFNSMSQLGRGGSTACGDVAMLTPRAVKASALSIPIPIIEEEVVELGPIMPDVVHTTVDVLTNRTRNARGDLKYVQYPRNVPHAIFNAFPRQHLKWHLLEEPMYDNIPQRMLRPLKSVDWYEYMGVIARTRKVDGECKVELVNSMMPTPGVPFGIAFVDSGPCTPRLYLAKSRRFLRRLPSSAFTDYSSRTSVRFVVESSEHMAEVVMVCNHTKCPSVARIVKCGLKLA